MARKKRDTGEINAGSMADIAFLLLIFFLVTTTMDIDKGIQVLLPPWTPDQEQLDVKLKDKNVLEILVNKNDQLLVEGELTDVDELKKLVMQHIDNNGRDPDFSDSPDDAVVSLQNDKSTSYNRYIEVYDRVRAGYNQLREDFSQTNYRVSYEQADTNQQRTARSTYPMRLSEAEPTDFGEKEENQ